MQARGVGVVSARDNRDSRMSFMSSVDGGGAGGGQHHHHTHMADATGNMTATGGSLKAQGGPQQQQQPVGDSDDADVDGSSGDDTDIMRVGLGLEFGCILLMHVAA
jgi:hypothetical protein